MKKKYVAMRSRKDIQSDVPGYTTSFYEFIEDIPRFYLIKTEGYQIQVNKVSTFNVLELTEKEKEKLSLRIKYIHYGINAMVNELKEIHDKEIFRIVDRENSPATKKTREMLRKGKEAYEEMLELEKKYRASRIV